jgi:hypothetical protein
MINLLDVSGLMCPGIGFTLMETLWVDGGRYVDENGTALDRGKKRFTMRKNL